MDPRHNARKITVSTLFAWSFLSQPLSELENFSECALGKDNFDRELSRFLIEGIAANRKYLDSVISKTAPEWPLDQIAKTDLTILRLAIFELLIAKNVPPKVAIDEAVELAKEFGSENSSKFVNGVLGTIVDEKGIET